ncbi:MAG TPA: DUF6680 family protein [Stellaceae bacterium]|nr:DUF6680 family protein [Stellaceae bacterium]
MVISLRDAPLGSKNGTRGNYNNCRLPYNRGNGSWPYFGSSGPKMDRGVPRSPEPKNTLFFSLMVYRATPMARERILALNSIDIVFHKDKVIIAAWREYYDMLTPVTPQEPEKYVDLLYIISRKLGYDFDKIMLRRVVYLPQGHVDEANAQTALRESITNVMTGQRDIQRAMFDYLSGNRALNVTLVPPSNQPPSAIIP